MNPSVAPVLAVLKLDTRLFEKALCGLDRDALVRPGVARGNPPIWIAAHLAGARYGMMALLGQPRAFPLGTSFGRGATLPETAALPQIAEVLAVWREISALFVDAVAHASDAALAATSPRSFPSDDKSVLGGLAFLAYHEGYHLGQLALIRKALGHPGLVDA